ncbi:MAG: hypothetical protein ACP5H2_10345 [Solirubrobacteraceae bacterium]
MSFKAARLGVADRVVGLVSVALLVDAVLPARRPLGVLAAFAGLLAALGILIVVLETVRRSPGVPLVMITLLQPVSVLITAAVVARVITAPPAGTAHAVGAYAAIALCAATVAGLYGSLRREGVRAEDTPVNIELIPAERLRRPSGASRIS